MMWTNSRAALLLTQACSLDGWASYPSFILSASWSASRLDGFKAASKPALVTDCATKTRQIDDFYAKVNARDYVPYATRRTLDVLKVNRGHQPD